MGAATKAKNIECVGHLWKNIACIGSLYNHGQTNTSKSGTVPNAIPHRYAFLPSFLPPINQPTAPPNTPCEILSMLALVSHNKKSMDRPYTSLYYLPQQMSK
jgi:hypothetical protein